LLKSARSPVPPDLRRKSIHEVNSYAVIVSVKNSYD
jgi:hypothetical protein